MKKIRFITVICCTVVIFLNMFIINVNAVIQTTSNNTNIIDTSKYYGIKEKIESLKKEHPNWNFKILYTGLNWEDVIASEYTGHGSSPKNLVPASSSYTGEWLCDYCGDTVYDSGSWKCASSKAIKYMMDSRNSLNSSDIFQFLELSYDENTNYSKEVVQKMLSGSFLDNSTYIDCIMNSSKKYKVNPYYVVARIIQEQGKKGSILVKGNGYNDEYVGYYNVFNIGASGSNKDKVILNGLAKAKSNDWTSLEKSLDGGIEILSSKYIAVGQNTLYFQKFDVENSDGKLYWHQYMQNVLAAKNEGATLRKTFEGINSLDNKYTFIIPIYENMPKEVSNKPSQTVKATSENTTTSTDKTDLVEVNVTSSIRIRNAPAGSKTIGYLYSHEVVTRLEKATEKVNGTYWDKVLKSDGLTGYVARCTYDYETTYKQYLVSVNETKETKKEEQNTNSQTNTTKPEQASNTTSNKVTATENKDVVKGDVNGDGKITSSDYVLIKNHIMGIKLLNENSQKNADYNGDGKVTSSDYVLIKNYIMGR